MISFDLCFLEEVAFANIFLPITFGLTAEMPIGTFSVMKLWSVKSIKSIESIVFTKDMQTINDHKYNFHGQFLFSQNFLLFWKSYQIHFA